VAGLVAISAVYAQDGSPERSSQTDRPKNPGLVEHVQRRLAQIEVSLSGARDRTTGLTAEQFDVTIDGKDVVPIAIDSLCPASSMPPSAAEPTTPVLPTTYLFYFDQRNMTLHGRTNSIDTAAAMIPRLIQGGNKGAIVSSGKRVVTLAPFTNRSDVLLAALDRLRDDFANFDDYTQAETDRRLAIDRAMRPPQIPIDACPLARTYQREEQRRAERALEVFVGVLGRFGGVDAPKVAVYFADTLRDQPGHQYISMVGRSCEASVSDTQLSFRQLHQGAAANGVKLYAVEAQGLVALSSSIRRGVDADVSAHRSAQGGLKTLTLETGGNAFLNGASADSIVGSMERDSACLYLLNFEPGSFPQDKPLDVSVGVKVRGVTTRTQTRIVIQSDSARRMSTLLGAFMAPDSVHDALPMRGGIVPLDVQRGRLHALVQASVYATEIAQGEEWDAGMSMVSSGKVPAQASGRIAVDKVGETIVIESEMDLQPGAYEIALVAMETVAGRVATGRIMGTWPGTFDATRIAPIAVLQPTDGAFLRDGKVRHSGSLVIAGDQSARIGRAAAIVGLVCQTGKSQIGARVHRVLTGGSETTFPPIEISFKDAPCAQVRDVIPANTLGAGRFTYTITVEGREGSESRTFVVE
jgi:VWFA-related protein